MVVDFVCVPRWDKESSAWSTSLDSATALVHAVKSCKAPALKGTSPCG